MVSNANEIWGRRLKEARTAAGLSQKQLGIQAGLDPFVASTRINRYELGVHKADYKIAQHLAEILAVPTGYFYTEDDALAELIVAYHRMPTKDKNNILKVVRKMAVDANAEQGG
jgi:transcriptional regulator with XRE-family HTH domain